MKRVALGVVVWAMVGCGGGPSVADRPTVSSAREGYALQYAVMVIELTSPTAVPHAEVTEAVVLDEGGAETRARRIAVEVFERPRGASEGAFAYYVNPGDTRPRDGVLPAGTIRLHIRASLPPMTTNTKTYGITVGGNVVTGTIDGATPSWRLSSWRRRSRRRSRRSHLLRRAGLRLPPRPQRLSDRPLPIEVRGWEVLLVAVVTMVISVLATLYPSAKASGLRPVEGLWHD